MFRINPSLKIVKNFQPLTIFENSQILDAWLGSEYASGIQLSKSKILNLMNKWILWMANFYD